MLRVASSLPRSVEAVASHAEFGRGMGLAAASAHGLDRFEVGVAGAVADGKAADRGWIGTLEPGAVRAEDRVLPALFS